MNAVQSIDFLACLKSLSIGRKLKKLTIDGLRVVGFCERYEWRSHFKRDSQ
ncbi:hypothetical protein [Oscillatoria nigro-viridis]|uniref:hypothetical protein n=1 Tax=Phormidium nigroviride TaxID=482564 RepID=UPI0002E54EB2|nr:hypothetical protein [Oscillatoria nigro-viridis]